MDDYSSFNKTKRQTINPLSDEINKNTEPILKAAAEEFGYTIPLAFRLYNQIRFYEEYGKLHMGTSVASKKTLAEQFDVSVEQITSAFNNLTNKYKLGKWVEHNEPVFRNVRRTWMSYARLKKGITAEQNYYAVTPKVLHGNSSTITAEYLPSEVRPLSESKKKVSESKSITNVIGETPEKYGNGEINDLFDYWRMTVGYEIQAKMQRNRYACSNLLKKHGIENLKRLIQGVALSQQDKYAPRISDFIALQSRYNELIAWGKTNATTKRGVSL